MIWSIPPIGSEQLSSTVEYPIDIKC